MLTEKERDGLLAYLRQREPPSERSENDNRELPGIHLDCPHRPKSDLRATAFDRRFE